MLPKLSRTSGLNETGPTSLLQADVDKHYSILQVEFARKFNGNIKTPNLFIPIRGKNASGTQGSHAAETNNHLLIRTPISSEFIAAPGIRTIFLNGMVEVKKLDQKMEHPLTIQIIPGTTPNYEEAKYLVLVHTDKDFTRYHAKKYISSLSELIKQGGKLPAELIESAVTSILKRKGL